MREILFRGKTEKGEWVDGYYYANYCPPSSIMPLVCTILNNNGAHKVIPETVGQYVGLKDTKGNKIFEGDIISRKVTKTDTLFKITTETIITKVVFHNVNFKLELNNGFYGWSYFDNIQEEVIGNKTDNPELLRGDK